jgi:crossover junction endodeoxyribonuclease RuvC
MRIIGIDPGLRITGFACVDRDDAGRADALPALIEAGVFRLGRGIGLLPDAGVCRDAGGVGESQTAPGRSPMPRETAPSVASRLAELDTDIRALLDRLHPDAVAVESLFAHYKHPATAIIMGHARGIILLAVERAGLRLVEFKPNLVKKSVTGHGHASKEQMQRSVQELYRLPELPSPPDMADAIAIALCAAWRLPREAAV